MSLRYIVAGTVAMWMFMLLVLTHGAPLKSFLHGSPYSAAAGAFYAPSAYKFYEAENAVTAAEDALRSLDAKMKSYEAEIAKAKKTVSKGMTDISEARSAANTADSDVSAAHKAVETAKSKLEEKLMAQNKIALRLKALEADVEHARGMMAAKTKEHESTAVEVVSRKLAVDKARADAMKAAQGLSLPPVFR